MNHLNVGKYILSIHYTPVIYSMSGEWNPLIYILDKDGRTVEKFFKVKKYKVSRESDIIFPEVYVFVRLLDVFKDGMICIICCKFKASGWAREGSLMQVVKYVVWFTLACRVKLMLPAYREWKVSYFPFIRTIKLLNI